MRTGAEEEQKEGEDKADDLCFSYEVSVSYSGKDGKYNTAFR